MSDDSGKPVERKSENGLGRGCIQSCYEWSLRWGEGVVVGGDPKGLNTPLLKSFSRQQFPLLVVHSTFWLQHWWAECQKFEQSVRILGVRRQNLGLKALNKYYLNKPAPVLVGESVVSSTVRTPGSTEQQIWNECYRKEGEEPVSAVWSSYMIPGVDTLKRTGYTSFKWFQAGGFLIKLLKIFRLLLYSHLKYFTNDVVWQNTHLPYLYPL